MHPCTHTYICTHKTHIHHVQRTHAHTHTHTHTHVHAYTDTSDSTWSTVLECVPTGQLWQVLLGAPRWQSHLLQHWRHHTHSACHLPLQHWVRAPAINVHALSISVYTGSVYLSFEHKLGLTKAMNCSYTCAYIYSYVSHVRWVPSHAEKLSILEVTNLALCEFRQLGLSLYISVILSLASRCI